MKINVYVNVMIILYQRLTLFVPRFFHVDMTGGAPDRAHPSEILSINRHYPISFIFSKFYLSLT